MTNSTTNSMTSTVHLPAPAARPSAPRAVGYAALGTAATTVAMIPSYLAGEVFKVGEFVVLLSLAVALSSVVLAVVLPRGGSRASVGLGIGALVTAAAFFTLLPGSFVLGALVAARTAAPAAARAARVLAVLAVLATAVGIVMSL